MCNMRSRVAVFVLALALLLTAFKSPRMASASSATEEMKKNALAVATNVLKNSASLKSPANRIKLRSLGASMIAEYDPELAQTVCRQIEADLVELYDRSSESGDGHESQATETVRADAVRNMAETNPLSALRVLRSSAVRSQASAQAEAELEAYIATNLLDEDPKRAFDLMGESESRGYSAILPEFLQRLRVRDSVLAREAAATLADNLMAEDFEARKDAVFTAVALIDLNGHVGDRPRSERTDEAETLVPKNKEVALIKKLMTASVSQRGRANGIGQQLAEVLPLADAILPDGTAARQQMQEFRREQDRGSAEMYDFWGRAGNRQLSEVVAQIVSEPKEAQATLYQQAAQRALAAGDANLAREITQRFVPSRTDREEILKQIERESVLRAADAGDLVSVDRQISSMPPDDRTHLLIEAVEKIRGVKDAKELLKLLDEARSTIGEQPHTVEQFNLRLQLAAAYLRFDSAQTGDILQNAVIDLNEILSSAAALDGYLNDGPILKDGEMDLSNTSAIMTLYQTSTREMGSLARYDYSRARDIANGFQRPEIQMMAQLTIAESVLRNKSSN